MRLILMCIVRVSIKNMLYTLHATYIEHDLYADFPFRLEKLLRKFSCDRFTVQEKRDLSLLRFRQFTSWAWIADVSSAIRMRIAVNFFFNHIDTRYCSLELYRWCLWLEIDSIIKTFESQSSVKKWDSRDWQLSSLYITLRRRSLRL